MAGPRSFHRSAAEAWQRRKRVSAAPLKWEGVALAVELRAEVAAAEEAGLLDPRLLDGYEADLINLIEGLVSAELAPLRGVVGARVAERVFGDKDYRNRLDRQLATGAAAVAEAALEGQLVLAASAVSLRAFVSQRALRPARPTPRSGALPGGAGPADDREGGGA